VTSGEVIETPFSAPWISSSERPLFCPVSFSQLLPWFHLPSNNIVGNTSTVIGSARKILKEFEIFFAWIMVRAIRGTECGRNQIAS
jgi:hypothetical protein